MMPELWLQRLSTLYRLIFNEVILVINLSGEILLLNTVGVPLIERNVGSGMILYLPKGLLATLCLGALSYKKLHWFNSGHRNWDFQMLSANAWFKSLLFPSSFWAAKLLSSSWKHQGCLKVRLTMNHMM